MTPKTRVLFVCTANAARSQMAEGLLRMKYGDRFEVFSAGTRQAKVSVRAIEVMREIGIDISHHRSKTLAEFYGASFDLAVTLWTTPMRFALSSQVQKMNPPWFC